MIEMLHGLRFHLEVPKDIWYHVRYMALTGLCYTVYGKENWSAIRTQIFGGLQINEVLV